MLINYVGCWSRIDRNEPVWFVLDKHSQLKYIFKHKLLLWNADGHRPLVIRQNTKCNPIKTEQQHHERKKNRCCLWNGMIENLFTIHCVWVRLEHTKNPLKHPQFAYLDLVVCVNDTYTHHEKNNSPHNNWITNREKFERSNIFDNNPALIKYVLTLKRFS